MTSILKKGGSVIVALAATDKNIYSIEDLMPVNFWSVETNRLQRLSTGVLAPVDSPFAKLLQTPGFRLPMRYDLHLPYSPMETGQHRYEWEHMGKSLLNTDWKVLLTADQNGRLPLLVEGRCYAGHVFVFGGDLCAKELTEWPGYADFVHTLLAMAQPQSVTNNPPVDGLKLSTDPYQPGTGDLHVTVSNPGTAEVEAVLSVKVRNLVRGVMNSFSREISVPAGQSLVVSFPEYAAEADVAAAPLSGPSALPWRRIEAGICGRDRQAIAVHLDAVVDRTPAVTLHVNGEDVRNFQPADGWPVGGVDAVRSTSSPIDRYVYFCGDVPRVTIRLANGRHNIAPLATAADVNWPANFSAQGLNDGACDYDNLRGAYDLCSFWAGRMADSQQLRLTWPGQVLVTGQRLIAQGSYRFWNRTNPANYTLTAEHEGSEATLATVQDASYANGIRSDEFAAQLADSCTLNITGMGSTPHHEPYPFGKVPPAGATDGISCCLGEWEVDGWPASTPPPKIEGHLVVTLHDLSTDHTMVLLDKETSLDALTQAEFPLEVPTRSSFGQVSVEAEFRPTHGGETVSAHLPLLFVAEKSPHLRPRTDLDQTGVGLLCSPGFSALEPFGTGTSDDTSGWGGPDNNAWAWSHDMMEISFDPRSKAVPQRFLLSPVGMNHYTDPYHYYGSGEYGWDWAADRIVDLLTSGRLKGKGYKTFHALLSDRWNGVNIWSSFTWSDLVHFDEYLRAKGRPGLQGRTRAELCRDVISRHADEYQRFALGRYADSMADTKKKLAAIGVDFTCETHGSFPLAGGKLGAEMAAEDVAVGTDLFWELRDEDVYKGIGYRVGLVAANPDLRSGAYDQWEWFSATQQNATWIAPSGDVEPARRQWYSTYWKGRVTSEGQFEPYTVYGFSMQGDYGVKSTQDDWTKFNRVQSTMIWVRPEKPTGVGIVASWALQEKNMAPNSTAFGFGLYAGNGYHPDDPHNHDGAHPQVDAEVGEAYYRLVEDGVPVSFVASTDTLKKWKGTQPLVAVDGIDTDGWEIGEYERLNKLGAPIIALGSDGSIGHEDAEKFFGVTRAGDGWAAGKDTQIINDEMGQPLAYLQESQGRGPTLFCPVPIASLDGQQSAILADAVQRVCGRPTTVPYGITVSPFESEGSLFLAIGNMGDASRVLDIAVSPAQLDPAMTGHQFRVVDHDRSVDVPCEWKDGALHFQIPTAACDGRLVQIIPLMPAT